MRLELSIRTLPEVEVIRGETLISRRAGKAEAHRRVPPGARAARPANVDALLGLGRGLRGRPATAPRRRRHSDGPSRFSRRSPSSTSSAACTPTAAAGRRPRRCSAAPTQAAPDSYRAYSNLGGTLVLHCAFPEALDAFHKARAIAPKDVFIASNLGLTQLWTGHTKDALTTLEAAAQAAPKDFQIWGNYGDALAENGLRDRALAAYQKSVDLAREALRVNATNGDALAFAATGLAHLGRKGEADEAMQKALAADPKEPFVFADAGIVAALGGRKKDALTWLRRAVDAGYCPQILARMPDLATLRDDPEFRSIVAAPRPAAGS